MIMPERHQTADRLREQAARCRRLAAAIWNAEVERRLLELADEFEERAAEEAREVPAVTARPGRRAAIVKSELARDFVADALFSPCPNSDQILHAAIMFGA